MLCIYLLQSYMLFSLLLILVWCINRFFCLFWSNYKQQHQFLLYSNQLPTKNLTLFITGFFVCKFFVFARFNRDDNHSNMRVSSSFLILSLALLFKAFKSNLQWIFRFLNKELKSCLRLRHISFFVGWVGFVWIFSYRFFKYFRFENSYTFIPNKSFIYKK